MHKTRDPGSGSWELLLGGAGTLVVGILKDDYRLAVPRAKRKELVETIERERFFELKGEYGRSAIGGPFRSLQVSLGKQQKAVVLLSRLEDDPRSDEVQRALRVWVAVRDLFELRGAVDSRAEDRALLRQLESR